MVMHNNYSVDQAKRRMLFESGEGARLMAENRELEFRLNQTRDTHKLVWRLIIQLSTNCTDRMFSCSKRRLLN